MSFTGGTAGIAAGAQTNDTVLTWALETTYKIPPTGSYQQGRFTAETLSRTETTSRPSEINAIKESSQSVVTQIVASGRISGGLSTGTYDDFLAGVLGADFGKTKVSGSADGKTGFSYIKASSYTQGLPNIGGIDDASKKIIGSLPKTGIIYIHDSALGIDDFFAYTKTGSSGIIALSTKGALDSYLSGATATGGASAFVQAPDIINGNVDKTYTIRKKILGKYLMYPGSLVNQVQLTFTQGQFAQVEVDVVPANEMLSDTDIAAAVLSAPAGTVHNTVDNFLGVSIFGVVPSGCVTSAAITLARSGSTVNYGNGHADGCGAVLGQLLATGSISLYFRTWDQYQAALAGTQGSIVLKTVDSNGNGYAFVFLNAALRNPQVQTDSVNKTYEIKLDIEGNPLSTGDTFAIFRLAPTS